MRNCGVQWPISRSRAGFEGHHPGKLLSPERRRIAVQHARDKRLNERLACRLVGQPRGTQCYQPTQRDDEEPLTKAIITLASEYGRYGYRCRRTVDGVQALTMNSLRSAWTPFLAGRPTLRSKGSSECRLHRSFRTELYPLSDLHKIPVRPFNDFTFLLQNGKLIDLDGPHVIVGLNPRLQFL
jgi:hypothetical protein